MDPEISPPSLKRRKVAPRTLDLSLRPKQGQTSSSNDEHKYLLPATPLLSPKKSQDSLRQMESFSLNSEVGDENVPNSPDKEPKPNHDDALRVYSWNVNGIAPLLQPRLSNYFSKKRTQTGSPVAPEMTSFETPLRSFLRRHTWPHILCLQEVKISEIDTRMQSLVRRAVNPKEDRCEEEPTYVVYFTLPRCTHDAGDFRRRLYGVCSIIRSDLYFKHVTKVRDVDWDSEGRVSVIEIHGDDMSDSAREKLIIYNIYAVNGTDHPYRDPHTGAPNGTRHRRKLLVHAFLMNECIEMESRGFRVIIIGDLNVAPSQLDGHPDLRTDPHQHVLNREDFNRRFLGGTDDMFDGVDVWRHMRGDERKYTYHPRWKHWGTSCDRVDLVIASTTMVKRGDVIGTEIWDSEKERGPSDHVPLSVDIRFEHDPCETMENEDPGDSQTK
jgi:exonuclease III